MSRARLKLDDLVQTSGLREWEVVRELRHRGIKLSQSGRLPRSAACLVRDLLAPAARNARPVQPQEPISKVQPSQDEPGWPTIGHRQNLRYLTVEDVTKIHFALVEDFARAHDPIDPPGIKSEALLESAVHRPYTSLGGQQKYPTVEMAGAALLHALILDHPFHNGNKRTALVAQIAYLDMNGFILEVEDDALFDYMVRIAAHRLTGRRRHGAGHSADAEMILIADWIDSNARKLEKGEYPLQFRELRAILRRYGAEFEILKGNRINIRIGRIQTHIFYAGEGREVETNTIHKVRKDLALDEAHDVDSAIFYRGHSDIPNFIASYRDVLSRLAKV